MKLKDLIEQFGDYDVVLSERIAKNEIRIEGRKPEPKSVWDLKDEDPYYWIEGLGYIKGPYFWKDKSADPDARDIGNIFITREDAEKEVERRKVEVLLLKHGGRRWFKSDHRTDKTLNWTLWYNDVSEKLKICHGVPSQGAIYFDSIEKAEKAISEIGEDRIKKALFEVR